MYRYTVKRTARNWKFFVAILVGVLISTTLFASSNVGANAILITMLQEVLDDIAVDMTYNPYVWDGGITSSLLQERRQLIESVPNIQHTEIAVYHRNWTYIGDEYYYYTVGIEDNSTIYTGMTHVGESTTLGANETFILVDSALIEDFPIGSNYTIQIRIWRYEFGEDILLNVTLQVKGHVQLTDQAFTQLNAGSWWWGEPSFEINYFIVDAVETFFPLIDYAATVVGSEDVDLDSDIQIFLDRAALINPYDIEGSIQAIQQVEYQINNLLGWEGGWVTNHLGGALNFFTLIASAHQLTFLQVSMPVFFIAIYLGITLSDVTFSLRRREVGLLLTKGLTRGQIIGMFMMESIVVGLLASALGLGLAIFFAPYFLGIGSIAPINLSLIGLDTIILTILFGIIIAVVSSYWPARRAGKIPTAEAIREYTLAGEPTGYRKTLSWTCFLLGSYKLVIWILGINVLEILIHMRFTNPLLGFLVSIWGAFDQIVGFFAPLLFLYGLSMILVKGSKWFYDYAERLIRRILGDLGGLAAHTIRRRPARTAAIIFISALLIGYGLQTVGVLATSQDLATRGFYQQVGADISVEVANPTNVTDLLPLIRDLDDVQAAAAQYEFPLDNVMGRMEVRAINVNEWRKVAYYEPEWFPPGGLAGELALDELASDNQTIILERLQAAQLGVEQGASVSVMVPATGTTKTLRVVGFFGPEPEYISSPYDPGIGYLFAESTWSYVSVEFLEELGPAAQPTGYVLVALESTAANDALVAALEDLEGVVAVESVVNSLEEYNSNILLNSQDNMMQMGVFFAFILASVGTIVVIFLTLRERRTTTALMSARGTTYGQTLLMLVAEYLTMMVFALLVGIIVGFIVLYGVVHGGLSLVPMLVNPRFLPAPYIVPIVVQVGSIVLMLLVATVIPILVEARTARYDLSVLR